MVHAYKENVNAKKSDEGKSDIQARKLAEANSFNNSNFEAIADGKLQCNYLNY